MRPIDSHFGNLEVQDADGVQIFRQQFDPDPRAMITNAPSTMAGYASNSSSMSCPATTRMATMPRMPPATLLRSLFETATATRIESIENARFTSSTRTTVAQNSQAGTPAWPSRLAAPSSPVPLAAAKMRV